MGLKNYDLKLKTISLISFLLITLAGIAKGQTCSGGTANITPNGTTLINGITITSVSTGYVTAYPGTYTNDCNSAITTSANALLVGNNNWSPNADNGPWATTLTFSKPVNDIIIIIAAAGGTINEKFYFTSNGGTISIGSTTNCYTTISGNSIFSGAGAPEGTLGAGGGGIFRLTAPTPFTTLNMSGLGGHYGSILGICSESIKSTATVFGCNNNMYLSQLNTLYKIGTDTNPFTYTAIGSAASVNYNSIGLNPIDGKLYAIQQGSGGSNILLVINPDGTLTNLGAVTNLPVANYFSGEIDNAGNYYVMANVTAGTSTIYKINLTTKTATAISLKYPNNTVAIGYIPDMGYSITTGLLYGVNGFTNSGTTRQLVSINPNTGVVNNIGGTYTEAHYGAMYTSSTGEVFGVRNDGGFYQFNLTTGERILISGAPPNNNNDGAHCVTMPITFNADLEVTKSDGTTTYASGTTTTYTVTVKNNGPFGVLGAIVTDPVPSGIPEANVSYTVVASNGSTTTVSGTRTGAINDQVGIPVGGTITYTVLINIPFNLNGNLTNTVTVNPPTNITDPNLANNTASDTDTQTVCYRPATTSGTALQTEIGITSLNRAGNDTTGNNWPMIRKGAWIALEAKTKGLVINRLTSAQISAIPATNIIEGMIVYNITLNCLQVNTTGTSAGWTCLNTPTCPSN
ncbi:DUF6923 family protein [Epilithonimonas hungarica]|uniref:Conserved repeat domain-containing protein n=1 Tax=Epilithonimonas hungarica TaxID=454006 RepID=A0A1G7JG92_9FLAO|nr:DUF11 domain-containing protein [Epilithonimonas hungarica]SDF23804.1 conserved repeat domain-containing protein [Epilithonimonas hungarica]